MLWGRSAFWWNITIDQSKCCFKPWDSNRFLSGERLFVCLWITTFLTYVTFPGKTPRVKIWDLFPMEVIKGVLQSYRGFCNKQAQLPGASLVDENKLFFGGWWSRVRPKRNAKNWALPARNLLCVWMGANRTNVINGNNGAKCRFCRWLPSDVVWHLRTLYGADSCNDY